MHAWCAWSLFSKFFFKFHKRVKTSLGSLTGCSDAVPLQLFSSTFSHICRRRAIQWGHIQFKNYFKLFIFGWHGQLFVLLSSRERLWQKLVPKKLFLSSWKIIERINYTFLMLGVTHVIAREKEIQKFTRA